MKYFIVHSNDQIAGVFDTYEAAEKEVVEVMKVFNPKKWNFRISTNELNVSAMENYKSRKNS